MLVTYYKIEERISEAVAYYENFPDAKIAKIAKITRDFEVPDYRLRYRLKTGKLRIDSGEYNKKLSPTEELALYYILNRLDIIGFPARIGFIRSFINNLLKRSYLDIITPPPLIS
jgi:hypothetical protein